MKPLSFARRSALVLAGWAVTLTMLFGSVFFLGTAAMEEALLRELASGEPAALSGGGSHESDLWRDYDPDAVDEIQEALRRRLPEDFDPGSEAVQEIAMPDGRRVQAISLDPALGDQSRVILLDTTRVSSLSARVQRYMTVFGLAIFVVLLATAGVSFLAGQQIAGPVRQLARLARDGSRREDGFATRFGGDDLGEVAGALEGSLAETRATLERERVFNLGLSHELRSSLQSAEQAAELLRLKGEDADRLARLERALRSMRTASGAVLWLGRPAERDGFEPVHVRAVLERVASQHAADLERRQMRWQVEGEPPVCFAGPEDVLEVILSNLVRNALQHSGGREVQVRLEPRAIHVVDDGVGKAEAIEAGLGLSLCQRLAERFGWVLDITANAGVTASLRCP